ncbi:MAG: hypothetical protein AAF446_07115 [Pseudomonadota bacterium]
MKTALLLLFGLIISSESWAVELSEKQLMYLKQTAASELRQIESQRLSVQSQSVFDHADRVAESTASLTRRASNDKPLLMRHIDQLDDAALREAMLDQWLSKQLQKPANSDQELAVLESLTRETQHVLISHHEMPGHTMPAFNVAQRSRNLLAFRQRQLEARTMADNHESLIAALQAAPESETFYTATLAAESLSHRQKLELITHFHLELISDPFAAQALLALLDRNAPEPNVLSDVITHGDLTSARRAVRTIGTEAHFQPVAEQALARPEIGGLAIQAWLATGGDSDQKLWPLLDDPSLGVDAARALAAHSNRLIETIEAEINSANPTARARMLLALKLRDSQASRSLLEQLLSADWLSQQQRAEVASWL